MKNCLGYLPVEFFKKNELEIKTLFAFCGIVKKEEYIIFNFEIEDETDLHNIVFEFSSNHHYVPMIFKEKKHTKAYEIIGRNIYVFPDGNISSIPLRNDLEKTMLHITQTEENNPDANMMSLFLEYNTNEKMRSKIIDTLKTCIDDNHRNHPNDKEVARKIGIMHEVIDIFNEIPNPKFTKNAKRWQKSNE